MKGKSQRALALTVVEVDEVLESLVEAKRLRDLTGRQRQQVQEAIDALNRARDSAIGGKVLVPIEALLMALRCVSVTQQWLCWILAETVAKENEDT